MFWLLSCASCHNLLSSPFRISFSAATETIVCNLCERHRATLIHILCCGWLSVSQRTKSSRWERAVVANSDSMASLLLNPAAPEVAFCMPPLYLLRSLPSWSAIASATVDSLLHQTFETRRATPFRTGTHRSFRSIEHELLSRSFQLKNDPNSLPALRCGSRR